MQEVGGLAEMQEINLEKAQCLYDLIDHSENFYKSTVSKANRSTMNVTFRLPSPELEQAFIIKSESMGFSGLGGHRSVGGIRASLYNGVTLNAVRELTQFMSDFRANI